MAWAVSSQSSGMLSGAAVFAVGLEAERGNGRSGLGDAGAGGSGSGGAALFVFEQFTALFFVVPWAALAGAVNGIGSFPAWHGLGSAGGIGSAAGTGRVFSGGRAFGSGWIGSTSGGVRT